MPAATLDLTGNFIIEQGSDWKIILTYPDDLSGATFRGQMRKAFGGDLLATFSFSTAVYDPDTGRSTIEVFLPSSTTESIPVPPSNQRWVYDLFCFVPGGARFRMVQGTVLVSPTATDI